jgi:hypothetical protein
MIWPKSARQQTLKELYAFNLDEEMLRSRFIDAYERAEPITWQVARSREVTSPPSG